MENFWQVYVDRNDGNGPSLDGCWGSENGGFAKDELKVAEDGMRDLAKIYPDVDWVLMHGKIEQIRIKASSARARHAEP